MTNGNGVNDETCREKSGWLHVGNLCFAPGTVRNIGSAMFLEALIEVKVDGGRAVFRISERIRMTQDQDSMLSMGTSGPARLAHIRSMPVGSNGLQGPVKYGETEFYRFETQGTDTVIGKPYG